MSEQNDYAHTEEAYECYLKYLALSRHFSNEKYDYFKMKGKVRTSRKAFVKRPDKVLFYALSKKYSPEKRILAHMVQDPATWVGDILKDEKTYLEWWKIQEGLSYYVSGELKRYESFSDAVAVVDGNFPKIVQDYVKGIVSIETLCVIDLGSGALKFWEGKVKDTLLFPSVAMRVRKYVPFLDLDQAKAGSILRSLYNSRQ